MSEKQRDFQAEQEALKDKIQKSEAEARRADRERELEKKLAKTVEEAWDSAKSVGSGESPVFEGVEQVADDGKKYKSAADAEKIIGGYKGPYEREEKVLEKDTGRLRGMPKVGPEERRVPPKVEPRKIEVEGKAGKAKYEREQQEKLEREKRKAESELEKRRKSERAPLPSEIVMPSAGIYEPQLTEKMPQAEGVKPLTEEQRKVVEAGPDVLVERQNMKEGKGKPPENLPQIEMKWEETRPEVEEKSAEEEKIQPDQSAEMEKIAKETEEWERQSTKTLLESKITQAGKVEKEQKGAVIRERRGGKVEKIGEKVKSAAEVIGGTGRALATPEGLSQITKGLARTALSLIGGKAPLDWLIYGASKLFKPKAGGKLEAVFKASDVYKYFKEKEEKKQKIESIQSELEKFLSSNSEIRKVMRSERMAESIEKQARVQELKAAVKSYEKELDQSGFTKNTKEGKEARKNLAAVLRRYGSKEAAVRERAALGTRKVLDSYIQTKVSKLQLVQEAMNTALAAAGVFSFGSLYLVRAGAYPVMGIVNQMAAGKRKHEAGREAGSEKKLLSNLKDHFAGEAVKTGRSLAGLGSREGLDKKARAKDAVRAWSRAATYGGLLLGLAREITAGGAGLQRGIDGLIDHFRERGIAGVGENFKDNAERLGRSYIDLLSGKTLRGYGEVFREKIGAPSYGERPPYGSIPDGKSIPAGGEPTVPHKFLGRLEKPSLVFEMQVEQKGGLNSIWAGTNSLVKQHAQELGFAGKAEDFDRWAEIETNQLVGGITPYSLVHPGDTLRLQVINGEGKLEFEEASGIKADLLRKIKPELKVQEAVLPTEGKVSPMARPHYTERGIFEAKTAPPKPEAEAAVLPETAPEKEIPSSTDLYKSGSRLSQEDLDVLDKQGGIVPKEKIIPETQETIEQPVSSEVSAESRKFESKYPYVQLKEKGAGIEGKPESEPESEAESSLRLQKETSDRHAREKDATEWLRTRYKTGSSLSQEEIRQFNEFNAQGLAPEKMDVETKDTGEGGQSGQVNGSAEEKVGESEADHELDFETDKDLVASVPAQMEGLDKKTRDLFQAIGPDVAYRVKALNLSDEARGLLWNYDTSTKYGLKQTIEKIAGDSGFKPGDLMNKPIGEMVKDILETQEGSVSLIKNPDGTVTWMPIKFAEYDLEIVKQDLAHIAGLRAYDKFNPGFLEKAGIPSSNIEETYQYFGEFKKFAESAKSSLEGIDVDINKVLAGIENKEVSYGWIFKHTDKINWQNADLKDAMQFMPKDSAGRFTEPIESGWKGALQREIFGLMKRHNYYPRAGNPESVKSFLQTLTRLKLNSELPENEKNILREIFSASRDLRDQHSLLKSRFVQLRSKM